MLNNLILNIYLKQLNILMLHCVSKFSCFKQKKPMC